MKKKSESVTKMTSSADSEVEGHQAQAAHMRGLFLVMAINMSWQLAVVILVPILGGYKLDEHLQTAPWWTLTGCGAAAFGMVGVLVRIVRQANDRVASMSEGTK